MFDLETDKVCLDSRLIKKGEYFVAVKGDTYDGHKYVTEVMAKGAAGILEVDELYALAKAKIAKIKPVIIGVTGSTGKSSVTSFITQILSTKYEVCKGSLNTLLGLSVEVINNMTSNCRFFVAEMAMDGMGQIEEIVSMYPPHIVVVTTINQTHMEKLGSMDNIVKAKSEILTKVTKDDIVIFNLDNIYVRKIGKKAKCRKITYGESLKAAYNLASFNVKHSPLLGKHNAINLLSSVAACVHAGMTEEEILSAIPLLKAPKGRLNVIEGVYNSVLIDDTYNASPVSTKFAIDALVNYGKTNKIVILGDMLELGRMTKKYHRDIGKYLIGKNIKTLVTAGPLAKYISEECRSHIPNVFELNSSGEFGNIFSALSIDSDTVILIKGSQGSRMEKVTEMLMKNPNDADKLLVRQDIRWKS